MQKTTKQFHSAIELSQSNILLPAKHQFVRLVIKDVHELTKQSGIRDTHQSCSINR